MRSSTTAFGICFNSQPPEGGWWRGTVTGTSVYIVSTHSRPKAAGTACCPPTTALWFQLTAARRRLESASSSTASSSTFQLTAARRRLGGFDLVRLKSYIRFNSQPPEGGWLWPPLSVTDSKVSTHSRPKAAGCCTDTRPKPASRFNSQPPEGGWSWASNFTVAIQRFNSQPPEGGWPMAAKPPQKLSRFNSQPPEGGWWR